MIRKPNIFKVLWLLFFICLGIFLMYCAYHLVLVWEYSSLRRHWLH